MQKFLVMMADFKNRKSINLYGNPLTQMFVISKVKTAVIELYVNISS
jgi:hypothetical protein